MFGFPKMFPSSVVFLLMTIPAIDMNRYVGDISDISDMLGVSSLAPNFHNKSHQNDEI